MPNLYIIAGCNGAGNRVAKGGHSISNDIIERRYHRGLINFFNPFMHLVNGWLLIDNSSEIPLKIAEGNRLVELSVYNHDIWYKIEHKQ